MDIALGNLKTIAVVLGIAVITISIMGQVTNEVRSSIGWTEKTTSDETLTLNTNSKANVTNTGDGGVDRLTACYNATDSTDTLTIGSECNLTDKDVGEVTALSSFASNDINVSYVYLVTGTARGIANKGLSAFSVFGDWFSILVIVCVAVIIIGLLTRAFGTKKRTV